MAMQKKKGQCPGTPAQVFDPDILTGRRHR